MECFNNRYRKRREKAVDEAVRRVVRRTTTSIPPTERLRMWLEVGGPLYSTRKKIGEEFRRIMASAP